MYTQLQHTTSQRLTRWALTAVICYAVTLGQCGTIAHAQPPPSAVQLLSISPPPPPAGLSVTAPAAGNATFVYWVQAVYTPGPSALSTPTQVQAVAEPTAAQPIVITWPAAPGAISYRVYKSLTATLPNPCTACLIASTTAPVATASDTGAAGTAHTFGALGATTVTVSVDNTSGLLPWLPVRINATPYYWGLVPTGAATGNCAAFGAGGVLSDTGAACGAATGTITTALTSFATGDPIVGVTGATPQVAAGTRSGNTTVFATVSGATTLGRCAQWSSTGNLVQSASACGTGTTIAPPYNSSDGGTTFWGPAWQLRKPNSYGAWTQNNWGASTVAVTNGAFTFTFPSHAATANVRSYTSPLPGGSSWTAEFLYAKTGPSRNNEYCGVGVRESATSKMVWVGAQGTNPVQVMNYTNDTTRTSTSFSLSWNLPSVGMWVRIIRSGATLSYELGSDPLNYFMLFSGATTVFFTTAPDQIGVFCDVNNGTSGPVNMNLLSAFAQ